MHSVYPFPIPCDEEDHRAVIAITVFVRAANREQAASLEGFYRRHRPGRGYQGVGRVALDGVRQHLAEDKVSVTTPARRAR